MGVPFPVTDVILVVPIRGPEMDHGIGGKHWGGGRFITVARHEPPQRSWGAIYHEVSHYYFAGGLGPQWLKEGGAQFMRAYIRHRTGLQSLEDTKLAEWGKVQESCFDQGLGNIQQLNEHQSDKPYPPHICDYILGQYLLLSFYETLGEEATSAALRELYLLFQSEGRSVTEEEIYQAFLRNTPPGLEDEFLALYKQFHTPDFMAEEAETPLPA